MVIGDIINSTDITNISGLSSLTSIGGFLEILSNAGLTSLTGLDNLTSIAGSLDIRFNSGLTSMTGLENLASIAGYLEISNNVGLTSITGLENLDATTITGQGLFIQDNPQLSVCAIESICDYLGVEMNATVISGNAAGCATREEVETACTPTCPTGDVTLSTQAEVDAFVATYPNCTEIPGNMVIGEFVSTDITNISGLSNLTSIGGSLQIQSNPGLTSLTGLDNLTSIGGSVDIRCNAGLTSMTGLDNLTSIAGYLFIASNAVLTSMTGLENLDATTITGQGLFIQDNPQLSVCAIESICDYLGVEMNATVISGNAAGCATREEVETACTPTCPTGDVTLSTQAEVDAFVATYPNCTEITGNMVIGGFSNTDITDISGLSNLTSIAGYLQIFTNPGLTIMTGLENITSIGGYLFIGSNDGLTSLAGLDNITSIGGFLDIRTNASLTSLTGLDNLSSIGGGLSISDNTGLTSLTGLDNITSIGGFLAISNNAGLTSIMGLENITSISGDLLIFDNAGLTSLAGLENLDATTINDLSIVSNPQLSTCAIERICDYLGLAMNTADISGNATGCATREEVETACMVSTTDISQTNIELFPNPTNGMLQLRNITAEEVVVYTAQGQRIAHYVSPGQELDLSALPAGVYHLHLITADGAYAARVVKQ
jgi:UDP-3-O-[3-hydroxymyristoyl] glucosamine N-acyltransferase